MANEIDRRVVEMQFQNDQFEQGVSKSLSTIDRLKNALNFNNVGSGIDNVQRSISRFSFDGMTGGLSAVSHGFSAMEVAAITVIQNITNRIFNTLYPALTSVVRTVNDLVFGQISAGWAKYGEMTSSVQTIIAATGKSIEEVTQYTDKLNWFTDETSYNLTDMTNNIGKFTSAGIDLETATNAMIGIANAAGLAGANAASASHAMAGFSKAMAAGYMTRQNWFWIETAKMDTMQFKQSLIEAGIEAGQLVKYKNKLYAVNENGKRTDTEVTAEGLRDTLSTKWLTKDVITAALKTYGDFASELNALYDAFEGSITTSDILKYIDQFKEGTLDIKQLAKTTGVSVDMLTESFERLGSEEMALGMKAFKASQEAKTLRDALEATRDAVSTGWMKTWELVFGNYVEAKSLWTDFANWLYDIFAEAGNTRNAILEEWHFSESGGYADFVESLENIMSALTSVRDIIKEVFDNYLPSIDASTIVGWTKTLLGYTSQLSDYLDTIRSRFEFVAKLTGRKVEEEPEESPISTEAADFEYIDTKGQKLVDKTKDIKKQRKNETDALKKLQKDYEKWQKKHPWMSPDAFWNEHGGRPGSEGPVEAEVKDRSHGLVNQSREKENWSILDAILGTVDETDKQIAVISDIYDGLDGIKAVAEIIREIASQAWGFVKKVISPASILVTDLVELFGALGRRLVAIADSLIGEGKISGFFEKLGSDAEGPVQKVIDFLHNLLDALTDLADPDTQSGLGDFVSTMAQLGGGVIQGAINLFKTLFPIISSVAHVIGNALSGLSDRLHEFFGNFTGEDLAGKFRGILGLLTGGLLLKASGNISSFAKSLKDGVKEKGLIATLKELLTGGDKKEAGGISQFLSNIETGVTGFLEKIGKSLTQFATLGATAKALAASLLMIAAAMMIIALIPEGQLARSVVVITVMITEYVAALNGVSQFSAKEVGSILGAAAAMVLMSGAILVLTSAVLLLALLPENKMKQGLIGITAILTVLTVAMMALSTELISPLKLIGVAVALIGVAAALAIVAVAVMALAILPEAKMKQGLIGLAAILASVTIAMLVLSSDLVSPLKLIGVAVALIGIAAAIAILAAATAVLSLINPDRLNSGLKAMGAILLGIIALFVVANFLNPLNMIVLAAALLLIAPAILIMSASVLVLAVALTVLSLLPFDKLAGGILVLAAAFVVILAAAAIAQGLVVGLLALAGAFLIIAAASVILGAGLMLLSGAFTVIIAAIGDFILTVANAIAVILEAIGAIMQPIAEILDSILTAVITVIDSIFTAVSTVISSIIEGITEIVVAIITGIAGAIDSVANGIATVITAVAEGIATIIEAIADLITAITEGIATIISLFTGRKTDFGDAAGESGAAIKDGLLGGFGKASDIIQHIFDGLKEGWNKLKEKFSSIGRWIGEKIRGGTNDDLGIQSPSKEFKGMVGYMAAGLEEGFKKNQHSIYGVGSSIGDALLNATQESLGDTSSIAYTPVVDLSQIQNGYGGQMTFGAALTPSAMSSLGSVSADINGTVERMNDYIDQAIQSSLDAMADRLQFTVPLEVDGRTFARATAGFTRSELNTLDRNSFRKVGTVNG